MPHTVEPTNANQPDDTVGIGYAHAELRGLKGRVNTLETTLVTADTDEATARAAADTTLQNNINSEATTRANADTSLQNNIDSEATARTNADTALLAQVTANANGIASNDTDITNLNTAVNARLVASNNLSDVTNAATARINLGITGLVPKAVGYHDVNNAVLFNLQSLGAGSVTIHDLKFSGDGAYLYAFIAGETTLRQYSLSTNYDITTATLDVNKTLPSFASTTSAKKGFCFKPDGTKLYVIEAFYDRVYQYSLSTAWDIDTASFIDYTSFTAYDSSAHKIHVYEAGNYFYLTGDQNFDNIKFGLSISWDISTYKTTAPAPYYDYTTATTSVEAFDVGYHYSFDSFDQIKLYVSDGDNVINVYRWDIDSTNLIGSFKAQYTVSCACFSPNGMILLVGDTLGNVRSYHIGRYVPDTEV